MVGTSCGSCCSAEVITGNQRLDYEVSLRFAKLKIHTFFVGTPDDTVSSVIEVRFKNNRKEFYTNPDSIKVKPGDLVLVECERGFDMGMVSLSGQSAATQFRERYGRRGPKQSFKILRIAKENDLEKIKKVRFAEEKAIPASRKIASNLNLDMKISDVEFQADLSKATFYYIAEGRVDFRELLKLYRNEFDVRIEMKQIGARQEAALVGGLGSCGRELCCSSWRTDFDSVTIGAVKYQDLPQSSQRLLGKCGKLKCCLLYEIDQYAEAWQEIPNELLVLHTAKGEAHKMRLDVLSGIIWYAYANSGMANLVPLTMKRVKEIIELNKRGKRPDDLLEEVKAKEVNTAENFTIGGFGGKIQITKKKKVLKPIIRKNKPI